MTQFQFPENLSRLAKNLFLRLTKFNISVRYSAHEALRHPWITRLNKTLIPMSWDDKVENMQSETNLKSKIVAMLFLSKISNASDYFETQKFQDYKKLLIKVSNKIDKWHVDVGQNVDVKEHFAHDADFIERDNSPTKFDTTSSEGGESQEEDKDTEFGDKKSGSDNDSVEKGGINIYQKKRVKLRAKPHRLTTSDNLSFKMKSIGTQESSIAASG